jgi:hypothetical protein
MQDSIVLTIDAVKASSTLYDLCRRYVRAMRTSQLSLAQTLEAQITDFWGDIRSSSCRRMRSSIRRTLTSIWCRPRRRISHGRFGCVARATSVVGGSLEYACQPSSKLPLAQCGVNSTLFMRGQRNQ